MNVKTDAASWPATAPRRPRNWGLLTVWGAFFGLAASVLAQSLTPVLSGPSGPVAPGASVEIRLLWLNASGTAQAATFPQTLECRLTGRDGSQMARMEAGPATAPAVVTVPAGGYAACSYRVPLPPALAGVIQLDVPSLPAGRIALETSPSAPAPAPAPPVSPDSQAARVPADKAPLSGTSARDNRLPAAQEFFKEHIYGYEPMYFIAGTASPNTKFQISFKYRLLNEDGWLAEHIAWLQGLHFGFTQTSLWDWNRPSAPFLDSSYKPEMLFSFEDIGRRHWPDWFRLHFQTGVQHESNGRDGLSSRSLNILYFRPTLVFGREDGFQFSLSPKAYAYLPDLVDNPDLTDYRGFCDLRATLGWAEGLQLAATGRVGDDGNRASGLFDLTYPLKKLTWRSFSPYFHIQFFTGYGESILLYRRRENILRAGFSLYR